MGLLGSGRNDSRVDALERQVHDLQREIACLRARPPATFDAKADLTAQMLYTRQGVLRVPSGGMWLHKAGVNGDVYLGGGEYPVTRGETTLSYGEWRVSFEEIKVE